MELVYLWIEDYKNIKEQGFNFSSKFKFKFDRESETLVIEDNLNHIDNFFSENINITAIVGKNGSGKSSLIEFLLKAKYYPNTKNDINFLKQKFFLVIQLLNSELIVFKNLDNINTNLKVNEFYKDKKVNNILLKNYDLIFDFSINLPLISNKSTKKEYKIDFSIEPSRIKFSKFGYVKIEPYVFDLIMTFNAIYFYKYFLENSKNELLKKLNIPIFDKFFIKSENRNKEEDKIESYKQIIKKNILGIYLNDYDSINKIFTVNKEFLIKDSIENLDLLLEIFNFDVISNNENLKFSNLSGGQKFLISYLGIILRTINNIKDKSSFTIIIDEIEIALHPDWQRKFLKILLDFINLTKINKKFEKVNIILISHSPFLISDLPKENIIFLDTDENGNCKVINDFQNKTFGANIHELLSHAFFMEDGLMGEFAKNKINEIIDFLNNKNEFYNNREKELFLIIDSIGEDFLREKLKSMYYRKFQKSKEERIKELKAEIERLEND